MSQPTSTADHGSALLELYDRALPEVYGYLLHRCRNRTTAEDLTAESFMAAVESIRRDAVREVTTAWLVGIARHKLVDHWRRLEREARNLRAVDEPSVDDDPWDAELDGFAARDVLDRLGAHHRAALTLRYVDDLPVPRVAEVLDRTVHATETLLVRARRAFRELYEQLHDEEVTT
ncbi:MAG: RNA polymerase sigma factor [Ilumatobacter sp.]|uniref:RNA polymerase sigma factor n=1 Tax=Ilumatobacter sp. TaxID=1967498 RepID=UPI00262C53FC|nr:RNA polymerase sigma factor [Ilumatobacter sp.]MDJ0771174.1 RNA polymerase sigma factor [Ilumatobacter sp.]